MDSESIMGTAYTLLMVVGGLCWAMIDKSNGCPDVGILWVIHLYTSCT